MRTPTQWVPLQGQTHGTFSSPVVGFLLRPQPSTVPSPTFGDAPPLSLRNPALYLACLEAGGSSVQPAHLISMHAREAFFVWVKELCHLLSRTIIEIYLEVVLCSIHILFQLFGDWSLRWGSGHCSASSLFRDYLRYFYLGTRNLVRESSGADPSILVASRSSQHGARGHVGRMCILSRCHDVVPDNCLMTDQYVRMYESVIRQDGRQDGTRIAIVGFSVNIIRLRM